MAGNPALQNTGIAMNPTGFNGTKRAKKIKTKATTALDKAIDMLGEDPEYMGADRLAQLIAKKLEADVVGTLKGLSFLLPKDIQIAVQHTTNPLQMSDEQLQEIIDSRTKVINGECETVESDSK